MRTEIDPLADHFQLGAGKHARMIHRSADHTTRIELGDPLPTDFEPPFPVQDFPTG